MMERAAIWKTVFTLSQSVRGGIGNEHSDFACLDRRGGGRRGREGGAPFKMKEVVQGVRHGFGTVTSAFSRYAVYVVGDGW